MISQIVAAIRHLDSEITDIDIADALWLALQIRKAVGAPPLNNDATLSEASNEPASKDKTNLPRKSSTSKPSANTPIPRSTKSGLYSSSSQGGSEDQLLSALPF